MTPNEAMTRLEALLAEERIAIRSVDATHVEALATEKLTLMQAFDRETLRSDDTLAARFRHACNELRNNAVILAHARNCLRDLVGIVSPTPATYGKNGRYSSPGRASGRVRVSG